MVKVGDQIRLRRDAGVRIWAVGEVDPDAVVLKYLIGDGDHNFHWVGDCDIAEVISNGNDTTGTNQT